MFRILNMLLTLSMCLSLVLPASHALAKSTEKSAGKPTKTVAKEKNRKKQLKKELARYNKRVKKAGKKLRNIRNPRKGLAVLSLKQIGMMESRNRTAYIYELRQSILAASRLQKSLAGVQYAQFNSLKKDFDLWAMLAVDEARAEEDFNPNEYHNRGMDDYSRTDACISAMNLRPYAPERGYYGCQLPQECSLGADGTGVTCSFAATGLKGKDACVPMKQLIDSSQKCMERVATKKGKIRNTAKQVVKEYKSFVTGKDSSNKKLTRDEIQNWSEKLSDVAAHETGMAELIDLANRTITAKFDLNSFEDLMELSEFNDNSASLSSIFDKYARTCNKKLTPRTLRQLYQNGQKALEGDASYGREYERVVKAIVKAQGNAGSAKGPLDGVSEEKFVKLTFGNATFGSVIQETECRLAKYRQEAMAIAVGRVPGHTPVETPNNDVPDSDDALANGYSIMPSPCEKADGSPCNDTTVPKESSLCSKEGVSKSSSNLPHITSRCLICAADRDIENSNLKHKEKYSSGTSTKWVALLATMAHACGEAGGTPVDMEVSMQYLQTFGHCSNQTYQWKSSEFNGQAEQYINDWQHGKRLKEDSDAFEKIYGANLGQLKKVFCKPKKKKSLFKNPFASKKKKVQELTDQASEDSNDWYERRSHARKSKNKVKFLSDDLKHCMNTSIASAEKIYSGQNSCYGFSARKSKKISRNTSHSKPFIAMGNSRKTCFVSSEVRESSDGSRYIAFTAPQTDRDSAVTYYDLKTQRFYGRNKKHIDKVSQSSPKFCPQPRNGSSKTESGSRSKGRSAPKRNNEHKPFVECHDGNDNCEPPQTR